MPVRIKRFLSIFAVMPFGSLKTTGCENPSESVILSP